MVFAVCIENLIVGLTRKEVVANTILLHLVGYLTITHTLSLIFYELACHPSVQKEVMLLRVIYQTLIIFQ